MSLERGEQFRRLGSKSLQSLEGTPGFELQLGSKQHKAGMRAAWQQEATEPTAAQQELGRGQCQARAHCNRGCVFGGYFSSLSATLPAAKRTGNLTIVTDAIVTSVDYDETTARASGVSIIDANTKEKRQYKARVVFLCASALGSVQILLNSKSPSFPNGIANSSGVIGRYIMDHFTGVEANGEVPGLDDKFSIGRRPIATYIPNYRHEQKDDVNFVRGYGYQATASQRRSEATASAFRAGIGAANKEAASRPGPWRFMALMYGEMLPYYDNVASLHPTQKDQWGIPLLHVDAELKENEHNMIEQAAISSLVYLIGFAFAGIGFLTLFLNDEKRAAHDLVSRTIVVKEF